MTKQIQKVERHESLLAPQMDFVLVDASGSMDHLWWSVMGALDIFVDTLKDQNVNSHGVVSVFGNSADVGTVVLDSKIATWPKMGDVVPFLCSDTTALFDAINFMGREMAHYAPERASIVIVTDGDNNGSMYTDADQARAILDWCRAQGWQVTFIGCNFDNAYQAKALGASPQQFIGVAKHKLKEAAKLLGEKRARYAAGADDIGFDDEEKKKFGGLLGYSGS